MNWKGHGFLTLQHENMVLDPEPVKGFGKEIALLHQMNMDVIRPEMAGNVLFL
jgi:hypothetical protein